MILQEWGLKVAPKPQISWILIQGRKKKQQREGEIERKPARRFSSFLLLPLPPPPINGVEGDGWLQYIRHVHWLLGPPQLFPLCTRGTAALSHLAQLPFVLMKFRYFQQSFWFTKINKKKPSLKTPFTFLLSTESSKQLMISLFIVTPEEDWMFFHHRYFPSFSWRTNRTSAIYGEIRLYTE